MEYTVQRYQGKHENEFLLRSPYGYVLLYENNVLKQYWQENEGMKSEDFVRFKNGRADFSQRFEYILEQMNRKRFVYHKKGLRMEIWSAQTGHLLYHGEYNDKRMKEGWGIKYDEKSGNVVVEGIWSKGRLIEVIRCFNGDVMTELKRNGSDSLDPTKRIPIYMGGFRYDEDNETFVREGKGCLIDEKSGIATREGEWKDGKEVSGVNLNGGWYTPFKLKQTIKESKDLDWLGIDITDLEIAPNCFNDVNELNLNKYKWLQSIEIGYSCFNLVETFKIDGLNRLNSLNIRSGCFTPEINDDDNYYYEQNELQISNCDSLESISIGKRCFRFYISLRITNLNRLKSLDIGDRSFYPTTDDYIEYLYEWGNFHIEKCDSLESISIGSQCFQLVKSLKIDGLSRLKRIRIGYNSFTGNVRYENNNIDKNMSGEFEIINCESLESIEIGDDCFGYSQAFKIDGLNQLKTVKIGNNSFNNNYIRNTTEDFKYYQITNCDLLESIEIGNDCFESVKTFQLEGLNQLKTIKIGNNSFTQNKNSCGNDQSKSFHILNCESLESIQIGEYSFSDFAGEFELKNLPQLQSIQIGTIGSWSYNFYYSSFVIRGIELILNI